MLKYPPQVVGEKKPDLQVEEGLESKQKTNKNTLDSMEFPGSLNRW